MTEKPATTRTVKKTISAALPADPFTMPSVEFPPAVREMAEKSVAQAKEAYAKFKTAAEEATDALEDTYESTRKGVIEFNFKALDAAKTNTDATFDFIKEIISAKSVAEAIELQTSFARKQFEALSGQAKEFQELATKIASESGSPLKDAFSKAVKELKAA
ncbi:phasin [Pseudoxanthobacter soli DSM 19599]|uniref:Phasin n=1 Tax=Pseudoxanthobacter soli DSM 19599 TaxID=1123029 RepID=A0A1M7ZCL7_9HYPH|nr:phasin [Pseudoxanthobacter soli]SHO62655.1 phasin [Pseudoxanthobacter soli DSM 19599]